MIRSVSSTLILALAVSSVAIGSTSAAAVASVPPTAADPVVRTATETEADPTTDRAALAALVAGADADALTVSDGFVRRFGYAPQWREAMAVHPAGACSSPIPLPDDFRSPCAAHDFGYDLLRAVQPASASPRRALDARLIARLDDHCGRTPAPTGSREGCRILVSVIARGLRVNTWRQDSEPPLEESVSDILTSLVRKVFTT